MKSGVYKITNLIDNKCYIGSSKDVEDRLSSHKTMMNKGNHHSTYLQNAVNKYGIENFILETVLLCPEEDMISIEQYLCDFYQAEYCMRKIAHSNLGMKRSDETKRNISDSLKGRKLTEEHKNNVSKGLKGRIITEEARRKLSAANKGKTLSLQHREKLKQSHLGYKVKEETKEKLREFFKGRDNTWQARTVYQYDFNNKLLNTFKSVRIASEQTGVSEASITKCAGGKTKQGRGFIWKYTNPM